MWPLHDDILSKPFFSLIIMNILKENLLWLLFLQFGQVPRFPHVSDTDELVQVSFSCFSCFIKVDDHTAGLLLWQMICFLYSEPEQKPADTEHCQTMV